MMNIEDKKQVNTAAEKKQADIPASMEERIQYSQIVATGDTDDDARRNAQPVDFRRVQHGHGPCACCGPYSE